MLAAKYWSQDSSRVVAFFFDAFDTLIVLAALIKGPRRMVPDEQSAGKYPPLD